jgi:LAS superfamily LD-carboxypeptidase LdcB
MTLEHVQSKEILRAIGLDATHLKPVDERTVGTREAGDAFCRLAAAARTAGIDLRIASGYRDYGRQLAIFNAKARGERPVLSSSGVCLKRNDHDDLTWLRAILRYSALPGLSRHHWGTDFDVWDAAAVPEDYSLGLVTAEYLSGGPFHHLNTWLSERETRNQSEDFFRPYATDRGGVAPEPWHISHRRGRPRASIPEQCETLSTLWREGTLPGVDQIFPPMELASLVLANLGELVERYVVIADP